MSPIIASSARCEGYLVKPDGVSERLPGSFCGIALLPLLFLQPHLLIICLQQPSHVYTILLRHKPCNCYALIHFTSWVWLQYTTKQSTVATPLANLTTESEQSRLKSVCVLTTKSARAAVCMQRLPAALRPFSKGRRHEGKAHTS